MKYFSKIYILSWKLATSLIFFRMQPKKELDEINLSFKGKVIQYFLFFPKMCIA